jgi:hypothetical protein
MSAGGRPPPPTDHQLQTLLLLLLGRLLLGHSLVTSFRLRPRLSGKPPERGGLNSPYLFFPFFTAFFFLPPFLTAFFFIGRLTSFPARVV